MFVQTLDVINVSRWKMDNGMSGTKVRAISTEARSDDRFRGRDVLELSAPYEAFDSFDSVPGKYELNLTAQTRGGKPVLTVLSVASKAMK